jgi:hypothetical protein
MDIMKDVVSSAVEFHSAACVCEKGVQMFFVEPITIQSTFKGKGHIPIQKVVFHETVLL